MKVAITGANGFVGTHLALAAASAGIPVLKIKRSMWDISHPPTQQFIDTLQQFSPDVVFHLAALSNRSDCGETEPNVQATDINTRGTHNLVNLISQHLPDTRLVFSSTSYVYGPAVNTDPIAETTNPNPSCGYGKSKLQAEQGIADAIEDGLNAVIVRAFQHSGPGQPTRLILPEWIQKLSSSRIIEVYNLQSHFDLSDVRDVVAAYLALAENGDSGEIYNVGSGRSLCSGELFDEICKQLDVRQQDLDIRVSNPGERFSPIADLTKVTESTKWRPEISLEQTVADTIASILDDQNKSC